MVLNFIIDTFLPHNPLGWLVGSPSWMLLLLGRRKTFPQDWYDKIFDFWLNPKIS